MTSHVGVLLLLSLSLEGLAVRAEAPSAVDASGARIRAQSASTSVAATAAQARAVPVVPTARSESDVQSLLQMQADTASGISVLPAAPALHQVAPLTLVMQTAPVVQATPVVQTAPIVQAAPGVQTAPVAQAAPASVVQASPVVQAAPGAQAAPVVQAAPVAPLVQTASVAQAAAVAPTTGAAPIIQGPAAPVAQATSGARLVVSPPATSPVAQVAVPVSATQGSPVIVNEAPLLIDSWRPLHSVWSELSAMEQCIAGLTFASMIKAVCMLGNVLVQVSPFPQVQRWQMRKDTGESDAAPYVSIAFGGWQWCYYGLFAYYLTNRSGFLILIQANCLGAILGTYYAITFYRNCKQNESRQGFQRYLSCVATLIFIQVCALGILPIERALFMTGLISSFCGFVGAISMLVSLPTVIRTQDSCTIPGPLVVANSFSSLAWWICGWMLSDPMISAPNIVCFFCSGLCLYLKHRFPSNESADSQDAPAVPEAAGKMVQIGKAKQMQFYTQSLKEASFKEESFKERVASLKEESFKESTPLSSMPLDCCGTGGTF